jgi:hypothetical protein
VALAGRYRIWRTVGNLSGALSGPELTLETRRRSLCLVIAISDRQSQRRPAMLAQNRTAQLSPRAIVIAIAAITMVIVALAAGLAIRLATTSPAAAPQAVTAVHTQVSATGADDGRCVHVNGHKGC